MPSLKSLKVRITSVKSTQKITRALKTVAAAKLRRATEQAVAARPYAERLEAVISSLASRVTIGPNSPRLLAGTGKDQVQLLVVATSERGLAGGFNSNIARAARQKADELIAQGKTVKFYIVGRKGRAVIRRLYPTSILADHDMSHARNAAFADALDIGRDLIARFEAGEYDVATLVYSKFQSALVQVPTVAQLVPAAVREAANDQSGTAAAAVEYEPDEESILAELLPRNVAIQIYRALLENQAGFYGAQMNAMDNATRNAGDTINRLTIQYNRTRQAAITTELVEIISGAEAL
ncbi:F0F1 ATP synthase subunit gamma [Sphingomonas nostoxanthinifaciens]|uniref:F0F1 ATP synthase subunit gamma n=1 Tax=Sphingomonas nostoxanthinifaciens TaxID=2872652 RepID=UPI001CC1EB45|nr:F0F1 ATP synthase subunit gamma [Sphingomonas nostoxanthinifaciens]UAK23412.1 F0F1 ATP synthase subunit gamma [Sphingomonas nostoxanthinifaciens]